MEQFSRILKLLGEKKFERLQQSSVTIIGLGAVGSYVIEGLARAGINRLTLVDFDVLQPSNINRQILALHSTLGRPKVAVAKERVLAINPQCQVRAMQMFADETTAPEIISQKPDLMIDGIDSLNPKVQLLTAAYQAGIPILSSMGAALRTDPGKIKVADLMQTHDCPLARRLRQRLRRNGVQEGIRAVFSTEQVDFNYEPPEEIITAVTPHDERGRNRHTLGSLPTLTGIFGLILANEAIMQLTTVESK